jgi:hypothetical protein
VFDFALRYGIDEERVIAGFLHASRLGIFEMSWAVLCPACGGVLASNATLKTVEQAEHNCAPCAAGYEPTLDEMVEVTFTVSRRVRKIAAHEPDDLSLAEYSRQVVWSSGMAFTEGEFEDAMHEIMIDSIELAPGEKASLSLQLPAAFVILMEPVTHAAHFFDVKASPYASLRPVRSFTTTWRCRPGRPHRRPVRSASRSRIAPRDACCPAFGSRATNCTACWEDASRS